MPKINTSCANCDTLMDFVEAWTESTDLVVIVCECPECGFRETVHVLGFDAIKYYVEGRQAYAIGDAVCPYQPDTPEGEAWMKGWYDAEHRCLFYRFWGFTEDSVAQE